METGKTPGHTDVMKAARLDKSMVVIFWPGTLPVKEGSYKIATSCRDGCVYIVCVCVWLLSLLLYIIVNYCYMYCRFVSWTGHHHPSNLQWLKGYHRPKLAPRRFWRSPKWLGSKTPRPLRALEPQVAISVIQSHTLPWSNDQIFKGVSCRNHNSWMFII